MFNRRSFLTKLPALAATVATAAVAVPKGFDVARNEYARYKEANKIWPASTFEMTPESDPLENWWGVYNIKYTWATQAEARPIWEAQCDA